MQTENLQSYISLVEAFATKLMTAEEFEKAFLQRYKSDQTKWPPREFEILDRLFADVDAFCPDESLREESDLDESQLRSRALIALRDLKNLVG